MDEYSLLTVVFKARISAGEAFLYAEVRARENFQLRPLTLVRRVLLKNRVVEGLEVETAGQTDVIRCPRVVAWIEKMRTRPAVKRALAGEDRTAPGLRTWSGAR